MFKLTRQLALLVTTRSQTRARKTRRETQVEKKKQKHTRARHYTTRSTRHIQNRFAQQLLYFRGRSFVVVKSQENSNTTTKIL
jgi:hypothetical protein